MLSPIWLEPVQVLWVLAQSLWVCMYIRPVVSGRYCLNCLLGIIHYLWLLKSFCFLFHIDFWALSGGFDEDILFWTKCSKVSHSLHIVQLWVFMLVPIYCKKELLWWELRKTLICGHGSLSLGVISLPYSFSRITVVGFPLGPMTYLVSGLATGMSSISWSGLSIES